ncbi:MAG TPA: nucleotidyltransferase domain-containing protein [Xanthobacteraceae bacterium]|jgi:hypothetical protein
MPASPAADPVLKRFRAALDMLYGDRIERVVLFGWRARGEAREDSDYDVAVFLKSLADRWQEVDRIVPVPPSECLVGPGPHDQGRGAVFCLRDSGEQLRGKPRTLKAARSSTAHRTSARKTGAKRTARGNTRKHSQEASA